MVKHSTVVHQLKGLLVKQNVLRAFTAICVSAITGMCGLLIWFATYWGQQMDHHTDQLNVIITQNATILEHQKGQDARIEEVYNTTQTNGDSIKSLTMDDVSFKIRLAKLEK